MKTMPAVALSALGLLGVLFGGGLWLRYGDGVFFDMLASSFAGCFF